MPPEFAFAVPLGLLLLAPVPLVILWHLRRLRRRRAVVASLDPWRRLVGVSRHRRRLPPLVLLALHVAAALALGLAAGDPRTGSSSQWAGDVAIVLDSSMAMAAANRWDTALTAVEREARTPGRVTVVLAGRHPRALVVRAQSAAARRAVSHLSPADSGADVTRAAYLARQLAGPAARLVVVTVDPDPQVAEVNWIDVSGGEVLGNRAVTAAGAADGRLFARIANYARTPHEVPLRVEVDGQLMDERIASLGPGESADAVWPLPPGSSVAAVSIQGDDALPLDDTAVVGIAPRQRQGQLVGESAAVERALAALAQWRIRRVGKATYAVDGGVELSVFVGMYPPSFPPGGVLIVSPPVSAPGIGADLQELHSAGAHPVAAGLDLAGVRVPTGTDLMDVPAWAEPVLTAGGRTVAYVGTTGESRVIVLALDPDDVAGNLSRRPAFPLMVARFVDWVAGRPAAGAVATGDDVPLPPGDFTVLDPDGSRYAAAGVVPARRPGLHTVRRGGTAPLEVMFGARSGSEDASDLGRSRAARFSSPPSGAGEATTDATATAQGDPAGPMLAALALVVILVEGAWRARPGPPDVQIRRQT